MLKCLRELWTDQRGFIVSIELVLIATIGVLGLIVGLSCLSSAVVAEYQDLGWAVRSLNQSYYFGGFRGCKSFVPGSSYVNRAFWGQGNNTFFMEGAADIGINGGLGNYGYGPGTGYALPVQPGAVVVPNGPLLMPQAGSPCPSGDCATGTSALPCPTGDCATGTTAPGVIPIPVPENSLPKAPSDAPAPAPPGPQPEVIPPRPQSK